MWEMPSCTLGVKECSSLKISSITSRQRHLVLQICLRHWFAGVPPDPNVR